MATKFLEPGGDADFVGTGASGISFWITNSGAPAVATDFVHGGHIKSMAYRPSNHDVVIKTAAVADAGTRISFYIYLVTLPNATATFSFVSGGVHIRLTSGGVLQLWNQAVAQIGSNGSTLSTGQWYRISLAYTITSTTVNEFRLFLDGVLDISVTDATVTTGKTIFEIGNENTNTALDFRSSDHYIDDSNSLTDTGDIWVTAKRPASNGTANQFTTQIGSGGSGYGSGHSPQVNERALSTTNGWQIAAGGVAKTEEYNLEAASAGDIDISGATIVDYMGWSYQVSNSPAGSGSIILNNVTTSAPFSDTITLRKSAFAASSTYPAGTGTDIGVITGAQSLTFSLYECGVIVAYIPAVTSISSSVSESPSSSVSPSTSISESPSSSISSSSSPSVSPSTSLSPSTSISSSPSPSVSPSTSISSSISTSPSTSVSSSISTSRSASISSSPSSSLSPSPSPEALGKIKGRNNDTGVIMGVRLRPRK